MPRARDNHLEIRELCHPVRLCLWWMCEREPTRSLAAKDLFREMPHMPGVRLAQVDYHLRRLQHIGLVGR